ncbi:MAG: hypothetical protein FWH14_03810 [Oscillospiraceae bacterium]|nr:hypothetical protein [Oscillospiraceae bacterium]
MLKITPGNIGNTRNELTNAKKSVDKGRFGGGRANVDTITIGSAAGKGSDDIFTEELKMSILKEVCKDTDPVALDNLREQVSGGNYEIDTARVAEILLGGYTD